MTKTFPIFIVLVSLLLLPACGGKVVSKTETTPAPPPPKPPSSVPLWLGNESRNFYGTGPWSDGPLEVVWEFETGFTSGRLHKDPWGGSSWPGQPSVDEKHVYFGSADGNLYCLDKSDGSLVWKFKTGDSLKATPTIAGDVLIASGLDHYVYCIDKRNGTLIWKYKTGFEVDCSAAVIDGRVYFGSEYGHFYSLNLDDGSLV
jgi:outer membrane protein assembly factor BamB